MTQELPALEHAPFGAWRFLSLINRMLVSIQAGEPARDAAMQEEPDRFGLTDTRHDRRTLEILIVAADETRAALEAATLMREPSQERGPKSLSSAEQLDPITEFRRLLHESLSLVEMLIPAVTFDHAGLSDLVRARMATYAPTQLRRLRSMTILVVLASESLLMETQSSAEESGPARQRSNGMPTQPT